jgi:hypothetical protein
MKKPLLFLSVLGLSLAGSSQTVIFEDNFDSYVPDLGVAEQSSEWETWDGSAGVDGAVSSAFAFSGTNSAKIEGMATDLVLPIGPFSSGKYDIKFKMYLTDQGGYFNVMHAWTTAPNTWEWAVDVFFGADGTVTWVTGGAPGGDTSVALNEWFDVQITADLDMDMGYIYINGDMVNSWQWSLNNADGTPGENILAAADFFGTNDAGGEGLYYIDDVQLIESTGVYTEEVNAASIAMWPNPANDLLNIALPSSSQSANVQIFDAQGRVVANALVTNSVQNIDVTAFKAGLYTVRVVCGEKVYAQKVVVE